MADWQLFRLLFGTEVIKLKEGDNVTIGRKNNNTIILTSRIISRYHCMLSVRGGTVSVTDLRSSIYIGTRKIPVIVPQALREGDVIGLGWSFGIPCDRIENRHLYFFKLAKCYAPTLQLPVNFLDHNIEAHIVSPIYNLNIPLNKTDATNHDKSIIIISDSENESNKSEDEDSWHKSLKVTIEIDSDSSTE